MFRSFRLDTTEIGKAFREGVSTLVFYFGTPATRVGVIEPSNNANRLLMYEMDIDQNVISNIKVLSMGEMKRVSSTGSISAASDFGTIVDTRPADEVNLLRVKINGIIYPPRIAGVTPP